MKKGTARKGKTMHTVYFDSYLNKEHLDALRDHEPWLIRVRPDQDNRSQMNCMKIQAG